MRQILLLLVPLAALLAADPPTQEKPQAQTPDQVWAARMPDVLLRIYGAQIQYQAERLRDADKNGIGDYAIDLAALDQGRVQHGDQGMRMLQEGLLRELTDAGLRHYMIAEGERRFWCFIVLPSGARTFAVDAHKTMVSCDGALMPTTVTQATAAITAGTALPKR